MRKCLSTLGMIMLAGAICLTGCKSQYGEQQTRVNHYPQCYEPVADLRADENTVAKSTAAGAAGGALLGGIIGFLATGKASGALAGAAAGGAAGAVGGNIYGKDKAAAKDAEMLTRYNQQLDADTASMNRATAAARVAMQCYNRAFSAAVDDYKARRITKDELSQRYQEIRDGLQETSYVLTRRYDDMAQKDQEYNQVFEDEYRQAQAEAEAARAAEEAARKKASANVARAKSPVSGKLTSYHKSRQNMADTRDEINSSVSETDRAMSDLLDAIGDV